MRILRWNTLLGRRLAGDSAAPLMLVAVLVFCLFLSLSGNLFEFRLDYPDWIGRKTDKSPDPEHLAQVFTHTLLSWSAGLLALILAAFALAHCRTRRPPEALILASTLPIAGVAEFAHGAGWFLVNGMEADQARLFLWLVSRLALAVPLLVGALLAVFRPANRYLGRLIFPLCTVMGVAITSLAFLPSQFAPQMIRETANILVRPWEILPFIFFAVGGFVVFPQLHRQRPTVLSHALVLSTLPLMFAQVEAALSLHPEDGHSIIAHVDVLLAYITLLAGVIFDYIYTQKSRENVVQEYESAQLELRSRTQELDRVDRERVNQERTLRILEKAIETMSLGVTVTDPAGEILYVNPADARMHGYKVEELLGKSASVYSPQGISPAEESDSVFLQPWNRERMNVTRGGRHFPVRLVSDMVRDSSDHPIALVTICEDISERKRIEEALERRDRILEAVGFAAERFLAETSWEAGVEEVLENLKKATLVDQVRLVKVAQLKPHGLEDTWSVLDSSRDTAPVSLELPSEHIHPRWERELRRGQVLQGRVRDLPELERQELEERGICSLLVVPIFVADDWLGYLSLETQEEEREWSPSELEVLRTAGRTFGAAMHRKQAEMALATSQARYQDLLENANDLVQSVSPEGRFQFVNRAWKEALGYSQEEVGRLTLWDVIHPNHHKSFAMVLGNILEGGQVERVEIVFVAKNGREIFLEGSLNARFIAGEPVATRGIFRDITERTIIDRMKKEFISTVSHELRTPLTSIIASLGLLQSGRLAKDQERTTELIAVAHRNSNRLLQLINDLLDLQKLAAGKIVYRFQPIDVQGLLEEALRSIQSFADSFQIELTLGDIPKGARVWADRDRLIQVLNNLLSNAIKFSPNGDRVMVEADLDTDSVVISVADHGPGIPEAFRARLFERFTQVDSSATRSAGGSGLGLSIVKGLVEGMNGRVLVDTEMGQGTTFHVELPMPSSEE